VLHYAAAKDRYAVELEEAGQKPLLVRALNLRRRIDNVQADITALKAELEARTWKGVSSDLESVEPMLTKAQLQ
jgi:hypothetical protein